MMANDISGRGEENVFRSLAFEESFLIVAESRDARDSSVGPTDKALPANRRS
jgi:hypothetical protein